MHRFHPSYLATEYLIAHYTSLPAAIYTFVGSIFPLSSERLCTLSSLSIMSRDYCLTPGTNFFTDFAYFKKKILSGIYPETV